MIEQLLQQRITIHTPLFSIRTHLIAPKEEDEPEAQKTAPKSGIYCSTCNDPDLTEADMPKGRKGRPTHQCKLCKSIYERARRQERKSKCA